MADPAIQKKLQDLTDEYQKIQGDLQNTVSARQRLEAQQQENLSVQREFNNITEDTNIYKLVGPVLLKQDVTEAKSAVDGRLEYIRGEIKRREEQLKEQQESSEKKKIEIFQLQGQMQQRQASQEAAAA